ncbi:type II toxin-antitoxin system RelE/ParE family toxin [Bifidobacterium aquikefiri]|uniref:type II toxin-antitoxin system RelE/ParE family toxin n=1 Tax=Bifidobacterium aquikefiri TaxID=1653207 RepID=UPI0039E8A7A0
MIAEAIDDIEELANFYYQLVDQRSAENFIDDVFATLQSLETFPESYLSVKDHPDYRRTHLQRHKVTIIYRVDDGVYEVIAIGVFHTLREPSDFTQQLAERLRSL